MAHVQLQQELEESKAEIQRLRERMSLGTPTVHKNLSLISLIPKWSGSDSTNSLEEFISTLEASARIDRWEPKDTVEIAVLKLEGSAKVFYQGCTELHTRDTSWNTFKEVFKKRYKDVHTDQYHYARLQMARKGTNESPQEFADRCRMSAQRITCQSDDPVAQSAPRKCGTHAFSQLCGRLNWGSWYASSLCISSFNRGGHTNCSFGTRSRKTGKI
jgi:hypothetical protein